MSTNMLAAIVGIVLGLGVLMFLTYPDTSVNETPSEVSTPKR